MPSVEFEGLPLTTRAQHFSLIVFILLLAGGLYSHAAAADVRFHSDEALYSTYARNASVFGYWMLDGPLDKPPLSIYANALSMHFLAARVTPQNVIDVPIRAGEFAARMPNVFAGLVVVALTFTLARRLYPTERRTAYLAMLIVAIAPFSVAYSASAFTDMLMQVFMTASLLAAITGRPIMSGLLLAASIAAKPQGAFYLPLVIAFLWLHSQRHQHVSPLSWISKTSRMVSALAFGFGLLILWDAIRPETSLFTLGSINISQGRSLASPGEWLPRLAEWLHLGRHLLSAAPITAALIALAILLLLLRRRVVDWALALFCLGFFVFHWIGAFFTFDRYLLPLVLPLGLLAASSLTTLGQRYILQPRWVGAFLGIFIVATAMTTHDPRADVFRSSTQDGYIRLADWINDKPLGTIIYDRWLGWEMGYYRGAWSDKRWVYYPDAQLLADDALLNPDTAPRYFIAPDDGSRDVTPWLDALAGNGFEISVAYQQDLFIVYQVCPPADVGAGA